MVRELYMCTHLQPSAISAARLDLRKWHDELPRHMQISKLLDADLPPKTRFSLYFAHLFYLSAMMLLLRSILSRCEGPEEAASTLNGHVSREVFEAVSEGIGAARIAARILTQLLAEGAVFQRCWHSMYVAADYSQCKSINRCCSFTAYSSCALILFDISQKLPRGLSREKYQEDLTYARQCLDVLSHCAKGDQIARRFRDSVQELFRVFHAIVGIENNPITIDNDGYVQRSSREGFERSTAFEVARSELFAIIHEPFGRMPDLKSRAGSNDALQSETPMSAEEIALGVHMEWMTELHLTDRPQNDASHEPLRQASDVFASLHSEHFIDDGEPSGWTPLTTYAEQAGASSAQAWAF